MTGPMTGPMKRVLLLIVLALGAIALGACSGGGDANSDAPPTPIDMTGQAKVEVVGKGGNQWIPPYIRVDEGTEITWKNEDSIAHNVKKSTDSLDFGGEFGVDAGQFGPGDTYSFTFDTAGEYPYTCTLHAGMNGRITVDGPTAATTTTG